MRDLDFDIIIVGARNPDTIISATRVFKHVLAVDCCTGAVVPLLKSLATENLKNVCLQTMCG